MENTSEKNKCKESILKGNREIFMRSFHDFLSEFETKVWIEFTGNKSKIVWFNNFWLSFQ